MTAAAPYRWWHSWADPLTVLAISACAADAAVEILDDVAADRIPVDVPDFAALHDYVDANEYGGLCDPEQFPMFWNEDDTPNVDVSNLLQDVVDEWITTGGVPREALTPAAVVAVLDSALLDLATGFTCTEADAVAKLYALVDRDPDPFLTAHAEDDDGGRCRHAS